MPSNPDVYIQVDGLARVWNINKFYNLYMRLMFDIGIYIVEISHQVRCHNWINFNLEIFKLSVNISIVIYMYSTNRNDKSIWGKIYKLPHLYLMGYSKRENYME